MAGWADLPILNPSTLDGGMALTAAYARKIGQPCRVVALEGGIEPAAFRAWLAEHRIAVSNVAGPRERQRPGVYAAAVRGLETLLRAVAYPCVFWRSSSRGVRYGYSTGARNAYR